MVVTQNKQLDVQNGIFRANWPLCNELYNTLTAFSVNLQRSYQLFEISVLDAASRSVFLKVGEIAPKGAIFMSKGAKKTKGAIRGKQHKGCENAQPLIDH